MIHFLRVTMSFRRRYSSFLLCNYNASQIRNTLLPFYKDLQKSGITRFNDFVYAF